MTTLVNLPHHDGSELYVCSPGPSLGEEVTVFARVPHGYPVRGLHVRTVRDGEARFHSASVDRTDDIETWWRATVTVANPVTSYRFLLDRGRLGYAWLTGSGVHDRDVTDAHDFRLCTASPPPAWAADAVVYQIFPDRFARSGTPRPRPEWAVPADWYDDPVAYRGDLAPLQVYGGDLAGIEAHLDHLESLGINTVYLTPFFAAPSNHRYNVASFEDVDPLLGGAEALAALSAALHGRGIRLIGDLVTNHTGSEHPWFRDAQADAGAPGHGYYYWRDHPAEYVSWLEVPSLPKLNYGSRELRSLLIDGPGSAVARWMLPPYLLDGWRVDVGNMTGRYAGDDFNQEVARTIRATMTAVNPDALLIAEHGHDYTGDLPGDGWQGTMNIAGFLRPVWRWIADQASPVKDFLGVPVPISRTDAATMSSAMRDFAASTPWRVMSTNFNLLGSHDTARIRTVAGDPRLVEMAAGILFTFPGLPMLFAGDEIGLTGVNGEDSRRPFPWERPQTWDTRTLDCYRRLIRLRRHSGALRHGGMRWVYAGKDTLAYLRETPSQRVLVVANRASTEAVRISAGALGVTGPAHNWYGDHALTVNGGTVTLPSEGPSIHIWALDPASR